MEIRTTWRFTFPNKIILGKPIRAFSIASSPVEGKILISTIITNKPSDFKQKMLALQKGDVMTMQGPLGSFYASDSMTCGIGIAKGIGIVPFRALLYDLAHKESLQQVEFHLIYNDSTTHYLYEQEFKQFEQAKNIHIHYCRTDEEAARQLETLTKTYSNKAEYFISGVPESIKMYDKMLKTQGIQNSKKDIFYGY